MANKQVGAQFQSVPASSLRKGDVVRVVAGELIPGDGEVIEGVAAVNEAAITGESAPVIRESGGDRSAVTGNTRLVSDWLLVQITVNPGESTLDRMIALVEGAKRQKTPNEVALDILLIGLSLIFLLVVATLQPFARFAGGDLPLVYLAALLVTLIPTTIGGLLSAIGIAGMDRLVQRNAMKVWEQGADFLQVFEFYREQGYGMEGSYSNASRVFRGSTPDGLPFTKDLSYLKGFILIYNYIQLAVRKGKLEQIPLLFCGKTTLEDMRTLRQLVDEGMVVPPKYLPPQFQDLNALSAWMCFSNFLNHLSLDRIEADYANIL